MPQKNLSWRDAILKVLATADEEMHYADIAQAIIDNGLRKNVGATPAATVAANLATEPLRSKVRKTRRAHFVLASSEISLPQQTASVSKHDINAPDEAESDSDEMGLINAFGMFWRRSEAHWANKNVKILGAQQSGSQVVDFNQQAGVYLLYDGSRVVYVGRVTEPRMGARLWEHTRDRLTGRWDRFSWFGVRGVTEHGALGPVPESAGSIAMLIATMEALLIEGLEPPQNRRQGDGFNALEFIQMTDPEIESQRQKNLLAKLGAKL